MGYSIHFPAESEPDGERKVLRLQIGKKHAHLESRIRNTSSNSLRATLEVESHEQLKKLASDAGLSVNAYSLDKISENCAKYGARLVDGMEGTYRGDTDDFLHHLFPYLEAFSPKFVQALCERYAPQAKVLLDPFGGLCTAPFTFAKGERKAYYCEVNPLMQHIAALKTRVRRVRYKERRALILRIEELMGQFQDTLSAYEPDADLADSYQSAFPGSTFFSDGALDQVLRIRTLLDRLYCEDDLLAACLELSILASLVPASLMQRAGDLRKKRVKEREKVSSDLLYHAGNKLKTFTEGLISFDGHGSAPILLLEDSRHLGRLPSIEADIVITSPPYLNGTNYFRNTKIELWFTRVVKTRDDLGALRDRAIAAGINDVRGFRSKHSPPRDTFHSLNAALAALDERAYDRRIPQMIRWYGFELSQALEGSIHHLKDNGLIAIDIGDSIYSGIRVPTDSLVEEILGKHECKLVDKWVVRKRMSRSGDEVEQVCMIAEKSGRVSRMEGCGLRRFQSGWESFKSHLPHQKRPYSSRNWGHPNHSLCSYQGKLKPAIARRLVDTFVPKGGAVLDAFAGVGTIPFEAALTGRSAFGFDISPAAFAISKGKLWRPEPDRVLAKLDELKGYVCTQWQSDHSDVWLPAFNRSLIEYFHPATLGEIIAARKWFQKQRPWDESTALLLACFMHVLHGNRPYALSRRSHPVTPFAPSGEFEYKSFMEKLSQKLRKAIAADFPREFVNGKIYYQDVIHTWPLEADNLDAVITSPPFFDSTRFHLANWIRLWFAGWSCEQFENERRRFVDEKQKTSFACYQSVLRQSKERLKDGSVMVLHLGKSRKCAMADELAKLSRRWFSNYEIFDESVAHCESHGIKDKGAVTSHQYLVMY